MTTDEDIMESMLSRSTNPNNDNMDELSVEMFCMLVRSNADLVLKSQEMIISKIRSHNTTEAIKAIKLLKECMSRCGTEFQNEIAKFRFLNDITRFVSMKYDGSCTPLEVKRNIMDCLLLWTTEFPAKTKIRDVYDMLVKEMPVEEKPNKISQSSAGELHKSVEQKSALGIDVQEFSRLINSKDPENYRRANLLIQHRVSQVSRLAELNVQHKSVLEEVGTTVMLLNQMLDVYENDEVKAEDGSEEMNLMRELLMACQKHKPVLKGLCSMVGTATDELRADTLELNEKLLEVVRRYKNVVVHQKPTKSSQEEVPGLTSLLGSAPANTAADNLEELLGLKISNSKSPPASKSSGFVATDLHELNDLFSSLPASEEVDREKVKRLGFDELAALSTTVSQPLIPEKLQTVASNENTSVDVNKTTAAAGGLRELKGIDALSEQLFRDLNKSNKTTQQIVNAVELDKNEVLEAEDKILEPLEFDQEMLCTTNLTLESEPLTEIKKVELAKCTKLADIKLDLEEVIPTAEERVLLDDSDIRITLSFTENHPIPEVSVIVISAINKSKQPMRDFVFEACVKKPGKVRLLPPTSKDLPPFRLFPPPMPINQVMLLLNPTGKAVDTTCIVGYKLGDDPDSIKESLLAKDIPYVK